MRCAVPGEVLQFPADRTQAHRIAFVDPGPLNGSGGPVAGLLPPMNLDAEAACLAAVMGAPLLVKLGTVSAEKAIVARDRALELLKPEHFYSEANGRIFQACQALAVARTPIDPVTVRDRLRELGWLAKVEGGEKYVERIAFETPHTGHVDAHLEIVIGCWERRVLIAAHQAAAAELYRDVEDWPAKKASMRAHFGRLTAPRSKIVGVAIGVAADAAHTNINSAQTGPVPGVPWGFGTLDGFGLLGQGKQHIIAGRPGMGKTALAFQVAVKIAQTPVDDWGFGEAVYWCSWEMSLADLLEREACSLAGVHYKAVQRRRASPAQLESIAWWLGKLRSLPIWLDGDKCSPAELAGRVRAVKAMFEGGHARKAPRAGEVAGELHPRCRLRVVAVDQLSEVLPPADLPPRLDTREIVGRTAKSLQTDIAQKLKVATVVLCQLRRPQFGKVEEPTLAELRESGKIEEGADEVYAIHRREYYERARCPVDEKGTAKIIPLKGRFGGSDDALMGFHGGQFSDDLPAAAKGEAHYAPEEP